MDFLDLFYKNFSIKPKFLFIWVIFIVLIVIKFGDFFNSLELSWKWVKKIYDFF